MFFNIDINKRSSTLSKCLIKAIVITLLFFSNLSWIHARQVKVETARQVASNLMFAKTRLQFNLTSLPTAFTKKVNTDNIYYVFNFPNGGWVIISADDVAYPVIAFSFNGSFSANDNRPIQFDQWMENIKTQVHRAISKGITPHAKAISEWSRLKVSQDLFISQSLDFSIMGPLLTTEWNQNTYYNELCPVAASGPGGHVWAGCVAAAMAQVMKYHNFPSTGVGSYSYFHATYGEQNADFEASTYSWNSMPTPQVTSSSIEVATLLYHAGVSVEMDYATDGSSASTSRAAASLKTYFKYSESASYLTRAGYTDAEWTTMLQTEINNLRPMIYRGEGSGGHAFVCDGYNNDLANNYFHFNWGWGGSYDGYFYLNDLTTGSHDYTFDQGAIMGITPTIDPNLPYPYNQGFEESIPPEWLVSGDRVAVSSTEAHSGSQSLMLSTLDGTGNSTNTATLSINVPTQGSRLSFWVKRGYAPSSSTFNDHRAILKTQFGESTLHTFYDSSDDGDYNDIVWQKYTLDMTPWIDTIVKLLVEQDNRSTTFSQWTYLDDVKVTISGDINADGEVSLVDIITGLQLLLNITPTNTPDMSSDVDNDEKIGLAEIIYGLQEVSGQ